MSRDENILDLEDVTVSFDGFKALNSLSLKVKKNQMIAIIGPNGAGKTTLQDVITGKTKIDKGKITFKGVADALKLRYTPPEEAILE